VSYITDCVKVVAVHMVFQEISYCYGVQSKCSSFESVLFWFISVPVTMGVCKDRI
jgi:hypothetical protein